MPPSYGLLIECQTAPSRKLEFAQARVVVGREQADLLLLDSQISTAHAELLFDGRTVTLRDLNSTNGTWFNGQRITTVELVPGMSVQFGQHRMTFLGLAGAATGRGRTVAVPQAPAGWQAPPAVAQPQPWAGPAYPNAAPMRPMGYPGAAPAPAPKKRSAVLTAFLVLLGLLGVGFVGLLGLGWYLSRSEATKAAGTPSSSVAQVVAAQPSSGISAPSGNPTPYAEVTFGSHSYRGNIVVATIGKDIARGGRIIEVHVAPSESALNTRSELLSLGLRADRPGTYKTGPTEAAISFSVSDNEHYLSKPGTIVKVDRLDPNGEIEGTFVGDFEHAISETVRETVAGKGAFLAQFF